MGRLGEVHIAFVIVTIFVAALTLFYIFGSIGDIAEKCKEQRTQICDNLSGMSFPMLIILLIIAGFVMIISTVVYIFVSTQAN